MALVREILPDTDDDEMASVLAQRLPVPDGLEALLESEAVQECMHDADVKEFETAETQRKSRRSREAEYTVEYLRVRKSVLSTSTTKHSASKKKNIYPGGALTTEQVKPFLPPDWRAFGDPKRGLWQLWKK
eukprot:6486317-Amphidinium_carterae.1